MLSSVVLPQPDGPSTVTISPSRDLERDVVERVHAAAVGQRVDHRDPVDGDARSGSPLGRRRRRRRRHFRKLGSTKAE